MRITKIFKSGNSMVMVVPTFVRRELKIMPNDLWQWAILNDNVATITRKTFSKLGGNKDEESK